MSEYHLFIPRTFKKKAKESLRGHWGTALIVGLIVLILGGGNFGSYYATLNVHVPDISSGSGVGDALTVQDWRYLIPVGIGVSLLLFLLNVGCTIAFARWARCVVEGEKDIAFSDFLSNFKFILKGIGITIWKSLWIFIWEALFIIPAFVIGTIGFFAYSNSEEMLAVGLICFAIAAVLYILGMVVGVIKTLHYSQMFFIATDGPIGVLRAMRISKKITNGYLGSLFYLYLTFIPWLLLGIITFGIAFIGILPYMETTLGAAYLFLRDKAFDRGDLDPEEFGLMLASEQEDTFQMEMSQPVSDMDNDKTQVIPPLHEAIAEPNEEVQGAEMKSVSQEEQHSNKTGDVFEREYFKGEN